MNSTELAYKIAGAVQRKNPTLEISVVTVGFPSGRKVFEYIGREGDYMASSAHSEGFFEEFTIPHAKWLAGVINEQINQRLEWDKRGKGSGTHTSYVRSDPEPKKAHARGRGKRRGIEVTEISDVPFTED